MTYDMLPEFEKCPQYQEFAIYSIEIFTVYFERISFTIDQNPINGALLIHVEIYNNDQIDYEITYIPVHVVKVNGSKIVKL